MLKDSEIEEQIIKKVEDFFYDEANLPYKPLLPPHHTLDQSPCYPIIYRERGKRDGLMYYRCKLHPKTEIMKIEGLRLIGVMKSKQVEIKSIWLDVIEHHIRYYKPQQHMTEILSRLGIDYNNDNNINDINPSLISKPESESKTKNRPICHVTNRYTSSPPIPSLLSSSFKCFYCDECFDGKDGYECNIKRIEHMDTEHQEKPHYPSKQAFENRLER
jgi:hypothetical protein